MRRAYLVLPLLLGAAMPGKTLHTTPESKNAVIWLPTVPCHEEHEFSDVQNALDQQGYAVRYRKEDSEYVSVPQCRLQTLYSLLTPGAGVYYQATHGNTDGFIAVVYSLDEEGFRQREDDYAELIRDYGLDSTRIGVVDRFYGFAIKVWLPGVISIYRSWNPAHGTSYVHNLACYGDTYSAWWGADNVASYDYAVPTWQGPPESIVTFQCLNGQNGVNNRILAHAVSGTLTLFGDGQWVLAPSIIDWWPPLDEIYSDTGPYYVEMRFNTPMDTDVDPGWVLRAHDGYILDEEAYPGRGPRWDDEHTISGYVLPLSCPGTIEPVVCAEYAVSAVGGHMLDGGGPEENSIGPGGDDWWHIFRTDADDPDCVNWATSFACAGAFREQGQVTFYWQVDFQRGTVGFDLRSVTSGDLLVHVPARAAPDAYTPMGYTTTIPTDEEIFFIEERTITGIAFRSRGFPIGSRPAALAEIVSPSLPVRAPPRLFPCDDLTRGFAERSDLEVPDIILVASRSDFLAACDPVIDVYQARGRDVQILMTSDHPESIRVALAPVYLAWKDAHVGQPPTVVLVGEAYEDTGDARNVLGTFYTPDSTGICHFTPTCARDALLVDFDGDGLPDLPWTRLPVCQLWELENTVTSFLSYLGSFGSREPTVFILDGDLDSNCVALEEPRATLEATAQLYEEQGFPTRLVHDSDIEDCMDLQARQDSAVAIINRGIREMVGTAFVSDRWRSPGLFIQKAFDPRWSMDLVPREQQVLGLFPGCDFGDGDRISNTFYPPLVKEWITAPPEGTAAVFWTSHGRGAWGRAHLLLAREFMVWRFHPLCWHAAFVSFQAIRSLGERHPGLVDYLGSVHNYGWPAPIVEFPVSVDLQPDHPRSLSLASAEPNPTRGWVIFRFGLPGGSGSQVVRLDVFDVAGRVVASPIRGHRKSGWQTYTWNGRDRHGAPVPSGQYYCRLSCGGQNQSLPLRVVR